MGLAFCSLLAGQNPDGPGASEGGILGSQLQNGCAWNRSCSIAHLGLCSDLHPDPNPRFKGQIRALESAWGALAVCPTESSLLGCMHSGH